MSTYSEKIQGSTYGTNYSYDSEENLASVTMNDVEYYNIRNAKEDIK
jgi:hypothetical protein